MLEEYRRDLHRLAELGFLEFNTQEYILNIIGDYNCTIYRLEPTGIIVYFFNNCTKTIAFRAELDALPISESNDIDFKSNNPNVMHACGHDGHMAMLLEVANYLNSNLEKIKKNVVLVFSPSEEENSGASNVISSHVLENLHVEEIYSIHLWPLKKGLLYSNDKVLLSGSEEIDIELTSKEAHLSSGVGFDSIKAASYFINESKAKGNSFLYFGKIDGGKRRNIIAPYCHLDGSMRSTNDKFFEKENELLDSIKEKIEKKGVVCNIKRRGLYPVVRNDKMLYKKYKDILKLKYIKEPLMAADDFGNYPIKKLYLLLGIGENNELHTPTFNFDESVLEVGYSALIKIIQNE